MSLHCAAALQIFRPAEGGWNADGSIDKSQRLIPEQAEMQNSMAP